MEIIKTCNHKWIGSSGSNDKPCIKCLRYPELRLRYQCRICLKEACKVCLEKENATLEELPKLESGNKDVTEYSILKLQRNIDELNEKIDLLQKDVTNLAELIVTHIIK